MHLELLYCPFDMKEEAPNPFGQTGAKSQLGIKTRGKIAWAFMSFVQSLTPLGVDDGAGANWCFVNGTVGVNSQSQKNRGKITISIQNKGTNARAPFF